VKEELQQFKRSIWKMRALAFPLLVIVLACSRDKTVDGKGEAAASNTSVYARCARAADLQLRASDELAGTKITALQDSARRAQIATVCKSVPEAYLPELRK
jgi:hypothetical protein